ncbi:MAG: VRR-NUC domain-containing protein [Proteobacteria bacterium]|nr:VRR-NUC domain-containing protein [Pseudomonadota bacterium]
MDSISPQNPAAIAYYLDHFRQVLDAVKRRHGGLLHPGEHNHITRLEKLSLPAQMLYARLVNRKGPFFRRDRLSYPEIPDFDAAVAELSGQALLLPTDAAEGYGPRSRLYSCFTAEELRASLASHRAPRFSRRDNLLVWLDGWDGCTDWLERLLTAHPVLRVPPDDPWPFLRFLFFGALRDNLADFVTREFGHVVTESIDAAKLRPQFDTRQQAIDAYRMACLYAEFRALRDRQPPLKTLHWWYAQGIGRAGLTDGTPTFDRLVDRLGSRLERAGEAAAALALYETSPQPKAGERRARLLLKAGRREEAVPLLRTLAADLCHAEEAYAARQMLARVEKTARLSEARQYQQSSQEIVLDPHEGSVEQATLAHFGRAGWQGVHSENWLWNAAFGLLFWDIIYDADVGVFHSPLQFAPADLHETNFYERRRAPIEARLAMLGDRGAARALVSRHHHVKAGIANPFVSWHADLPTVIHLMIDRVPPEGLSAVLRRFAQDIKRRSCGFPDLFLWNDKTYRFVEVKSVNDRLSAAQYEWLRFFETAGLFVALSNIRYGTGTERGSRRRNG